MYTRLNEEAKRHFEHQQRWLGGAAKVVQQTEFGRAIMSRVVTSAKPTRCKTCGQPLECQNKIK